LDLLSLHPGEDDDLIQWFAQVPKRLRAIEVKRALRSGGVRLATSEVPDEAENEAALDALLA